MMGRDFRNAFKGSAVGAVSFSIDMQLVEQLKQALPLSIFVETGTFEGATVQQAIGRFEEIYSVELSQEYYSAACARFQGEASVKLYHDSSEQFLQGLCSSLREKSVLYWLDAHWCVAESTAGSESQCPLLQELAAIRALNSESVILIDDARLFLCTPPKPHNINQWPTLNAVLKALYSLSSEHEVMVVNDVIVYYPARLSAVLNHYAHHHSIDWLYVLHQYKAVAELQAQLEEKEAVIQALAKEGQERLKIIEQQQQAIDRIEQKSSSRSGG